MDEILASIRRIIESGEDRTPAQAAGSARAEAKQSAEAATSSEARLAPPSERAASEQAQSDVHYLPSAFGEPSGEFSGPESAATAEDVPEPAKTVLTQKTDGQSKVEAEVDTVRVEASASEQPSAVSVGTAAEDRLDPTVAPKAGNENGTRIEPSADAESARSLADFTFEFNDEQFEAALRNGGWDDESASRDVAGSALQKMHGAAAEDAGAPARQMPESVIDGASALLSAEAGDQVASAFNDLARAIREGHMRSMEEMAREMMRPMLQEWLDDNLPRLVERLVREEIERVARGARY